MFVFRSTLVSLLLGSLLVLSLACESELSTSLEGRPCDAEGNCLPGYVCDSATQRCVRPPFENDDEPSETPPTCHAECAGVCVDLERDARNCGACGRVCPNGPGGLGVCSAGVCKVECSPPLSTCNGTCVEIDSDPRNCGACAAPCADGRVCSNGTCANVCAAGEIDCGYACVDARTDRLNCGACEQTCEDPANGTASCVNGTCQTTCAQGFTECDGACKNLDSDPNNCGACGKLCSSKQSCVVRLCL
jgi:hypothetical protein